MPRSEWKQENPERAAELQRKYRERTGSKDAPRRYARWTEEEDAQVLAHTVPDRVLAERLQRSVTAINVRRKNLKARGRI